MSNVKIKIKPHTVFVETGWSDIDPGFMDGYCEETGKVEWKVELLDGQRELDRFKASGIAENEDQGRRMANAVVEAFLEEQNS